MKNLKYLIANGTIEGRRIVRLFDIISMLVGFGIVLFACYIVTIGLLNSVCNSVVCK